MREIEGIEAVVEKLKPHLAAIKQNFEHENQIFIGLTSTTHDTLGRILKCHLIVEHYLGRFLVSHFGIDNFDNVGLSFAQKARLLPDRATAASFVKPGVVRLNQIRNNFAHSLGAELSDVDLGPIRTVLAIARRGVAFESPVEAIEAFTTVACTFLIVAPPDLQQVFVEAFKTVHVRVDAEEGPGGYPGSGRRPRHSAQAAVPAAETIRPL